jgi:hypothetical protein
LYLCFIYHLWKIWHQDVSSSSVCRFILVSESEKQQYRHDDSASQLQASTNLSMVAQIWTTYAKPIRTKPYLFEQAYLYCSKSSFCSHTVWFSLKWDCWWQIHQKFLQIDWQQAYIDLIKVGNFSLAKDIVSSGSL